MFLTRLSSAMDFCFGLAAIVLILDMIFIRSAGGSPKDSNKIQLSMGIARYPFLHLPVNISSSQNRNPFLQPINGNKNENPFLPSSFPSQPSNTEPPNNNPFPNRINNPFLNPTRTDTKVDISESSSSSRPITQNPYTSPPNYYTTSERVPDIIVFNTPAPVDDFTTSRTHPSPKNPPVSRFPSLDDLISIKDPVKTISEVKCDKYIEEFAGTTSISTLTGSSPAVMKVNNVCENTNRLVVNGIEAEVGEFPHMVALGRRGSEFFLMCGGTLISHTWVLSAAHCTYGPDGGPTDARIGFHRLTDQEGVTIAIKNATRHPEYKAPAMYADIALVQLAEAVTFSTFIRPACLYQEYATMPRNAWVSGWGVKEQNGEISDRLQKAQLELIDNLSCTIRHNSSTEIPYGIIPSMICAGDPRGNWATDTCQGDSGGPLQIIHSKSKCLFQVIGVTSFGQGCAMIDIPGVYTRVSHYLSWIEDIVWPQGR